MPDDSPSRGDDGEAQARELLASLLRQISHDDSPPSNINSVYPGSSLSRPGSFSPRSDLSSVGDHHHHHHGVVLHRPPRPKTKYSRQRHVVPSSPDGGSVSSLTSAVTMSTNGDPSSSSSSSASVLGHSSLAAYVSRALDGREALGLPARARANSEGSALHLVLLDDDGGRRPRCLSSDSSARSLSAAGRRFLADDGVEVVVAASDAMAPPPQMFGSEYARFLSSTVFAPRPAPARPRRFDLPGRRSAARARGSDRPRLRLLEEAPAAVLAGPVTDVVVTRGNETPPRGFYRVSQTGDADRGDLRRGGGGGPSYLNVKKEPNWDRAAQRPCVTALAVILPDRSEFVPPGYCIVRRLNGESADLGGAEKVLLCFKKSREGNPVTGIVPLRPSKGECVPDGYTVIERTPRNFVADTNAGAGPAMFLAFRQRLSNLETLRPSPLARRETGPRPTGYFCTGATVVDANVGGLHIMDRSTHTMLSPSSVTNRLTVLSRDNSASSRSSATASDDRRHRRRRRPSLRPDDDSEDRERESLVGGGALDFIPTVTDASGRAARPWRARLLTPVLTACYAHHGGAAGVAVEGLHRLLKETDFFKDDAAARGRDDRITLLDLTVQVVCDVATSSSRETHFPGCVDLVTDAVTLARGRLSARTIGYALRFYLFVFYFGAIVPTPSSWPHTRGDGDGDDDVPMLLETPSRTGGAPQASLLGLKRMTTLLCARLDDEREQTSEEARFAHDAHKRSDDAESFVRSLVHDVVSDSVDLVDVERHVELASHQIHRSGGSELFWYDMIHSCGERIFGRERPAHVVLFGTLAFLVKTATGDVRRYQGTGVPYPRDAATKLASLELLAHLLREAAPRVGDPRGRDRARNAAACAARRLVAPCLLGNSRAGLEDPRVFRRTLAVATELWRSYRTHLRAETAVLSEHFLTRVVRAGPRLVPFARRDATGPAALCADHQSDALSEVEEWLRDPHDVLELALNHDMEAGAAPVFLRLCAGLCRLAERCGEIVADRIHSARGSSAAAIGGGVRDAEELASTRDTARSTQEKCLDAVCHVVRLLMDASYQVYRRERRGGLWKDDDRGPSALPHADSFCSGDECYDDGARDDEDEDEPTDASSLESGSPKRFVRKRLSFTRRASRSPARAKTPSSPRTTSFPKSLFGGGGGGSVPNLPRSVSTGAGGGLKHPPPPPTTPRTASEGIIRQPRPPPPSTTAANAPLPSPVSLDRKGRSDVVSEREADRKRSSETLQIAFGIVENDGLKKALDYLVACNSLVGGPRETASFLRVHQKKIDPAVLGEYLGEGGHAGDREYWNLIRYHYVRAISFVGKTVETSLRIFLTRSGFRLPGESQKIDRILTTFAQCFWEDNVGDHANCPFHHRDTIIVLAFAIIMLNTDLHRVNPAGSRGAGRRSKDRRRMTRPEFVSNVRNSDEASDLSKDFLGEIYDSIESNPIELHGSPSSTASSSSYRGDAAAGFLGNVKPALELLRGLAVREHRFVATRNDEDVFSWDLVRHVFRSVWHHFYGMVNATLDTVQLDPQSIGSCLTVLKYAICATIFLDLEIERRAFAAQLARIKYLKERGLEEGARIGLRRDQNSLLVDEQRNERWFRTIENACASHRHVSDAVDQVQSLTRDLRASLKIDTRANREMHRVTRRIRNGELLLDDPTRTFVRDAELLKRCNRTGRLVLYRFFLFSDLLIYTKKSSDRGDYRIHEELPLYLMKIANVTCDKGTKHAHRFQIHHPRKSFVVCAPTAERKSRWMEDIQNMIASSLERKAGVPGARIGSEVWKRS